MEITIILLVIIGSSSYLIYRAVSGAKTYIFAKNPPNKKLGESQKAFQVRKSEAATVWAKEVLANKEHYVILDSETTGLSPNDVIVQLALIDLHGKVLIDSLIKPTKRKRMSTQAAEIHGIKFADLKHAPSLLSLADQIDSITKGKTVLIYNADFDVRLLNQSLQQDGAKKLFKLTTECVMKKYSEYIGEWSEYHGNFKLQRLPGGDHSAIGDCRATLETIKQMGIYEELV